MNKYAKILAEGTPTFSCLFRFSLVELENGIIEVLMIANKNKIYSQRFTTRAEANRYIRRMKGAKT